jgi:ribonuclease T1
LSSTWCRLVAVLLALSLFASGAASAQRAPTAIPEVAAAELPAEARQTIAQIRKGGPFLHERDGAPFRNFEKQLPVRSRGYYSEYTVRTPGVKNRGARRIVAGKGGEFYYTDDHYRSFRRIQEP